MLETSLLYFTIFATLLIVIAFIRSKDIILITLLNGAFSLFTVIMYLLLDAPDVAMTEAAVSALVTIFAVCAIKHIYKQNYVIVDQFNPAFFILTLILAAFLIDASLDLPTFGQPTFSHYYLENSLADIGIPAVVTSVLASYRGYDTLFETLVIMIGGLAILMISELNVIPGKLRSSADRGSQELRFSQDLRSSATSAPSSGITLQDTDLLISKLIRFIFPIILLFALYLQWHGEISPGGGFQAGSIFAITLILYAMSFGAHNLLAFISLERLKFIAVSGVLLYFMVGLLGLFAEAEFLNYNIAILGQKTGIIVVELGVGISVAATMLIIYLNLVD